ncbi:MAG: hypothetical protein HKN20_13950 [Gemmatimonadetes bacterium]|nr:hypothetical protein [Gemmatimonadota bacterium]
MKRAPFVLFLLVLPLLIFFSLTNRASAQESSVMNDLIGEWKGEGKLFGTPASFSMQWERVLGQRFVRLTFENRMRIPDAEDRVMTAQAYYKPKEGGLYDGTWFDSRGVVQPLQGTAAGSELTVIWGTPTTEQGRTAYRVTGAGTVEVEDFVLRNDVWQRFGHATYRRVPALAGASTPAGEVVFSTNRDGNFEIYLMQADGTNPVNLTMNAAYDYAPCWSPDGTRLAFQTDRDGNSEIYLMNADGTGLVNLTNHPAKDAAPDWSPDGKQLLFVSDRDGDGRELYVMNVDGSDARRLTNNGAYEEMPAWSPDGARIAFCRELKDPSDSSHAGNGEVFLMDADGSNERRLIDREGFDSGPAWSPDGKRIAFHSTHSEGADVLIMDADGNGLETITEGGGGDYYPAWSPDGTWMIYCTGQGKQYNLWRMRPDGTDRVRLTDHPGRDHDPAWRPVRQVR